MDGWSVFLINDQINDAIAQEFIYSQWRDHIPPAAYRSVIARSQIAPNSNPLSMCV